MSGNNMQILIAMAAYLLLSILIGIFYAKKRNKTTDEYFLGGRGLGAWIAAMSAEASDMSGWLLMGLPGVAYFTGAGEAVWTAIGLAIGTYVNWRIVSVRLRKYSQIAGNSITIPDFFSNRFKDNKKILMTIASIIILVFFSIYVGSQFVTFGKLFAYVFDTDNYYTVMVILGAIFVFVYTFLGGFLAESVTDFIQGLLMFCALLVTVIVCIIKLDSQSINNLNEIPRFLDIFGIATPLDSAGNTVSAAIGNQQAVINSKPLFGSGSDYGVLNMLSCLAWGLGYFGMPQVLLRFMAIKTTKELKKSRIIAIVWCFISLGAAVAIGLIGRGLMPTELLIPGTSERIFIVLTVKFFPPLIAGVVLSGILAASMSSSDSYMLIASSAVSKNLFAKLFRKEATDRQIMLVARLSLVIITLFGVWVALSGNETIFSIVSYAWAGLGAAFGPLMLFSLFWKRTTLPAAIAGMVSGGAMVIIWDQLRNVWGDKVNILNLYELLPAFVISCIVIFIVSLLTKEPSDEIQKEFETMKTADI
ncbi:MAG TPA: sodium/proline symporter [Clostridiales bacterium]|nr:sodium/proline symporter [Clostridiales bacterium]